MKHHLLPLLAFLAAGLLACGPAAAQELPETAERDLWCGLAFAHAAGELPGDASARQRAVIPHFAAGAEMLLERAEAAFRQGSYDAERFAVRRTELAAEIARRLSADEPVPYSFEDCAALLEP